ncbi:hypothetical protein ACIQAA_18760 [Neobacillus sp. NPDC093182]|uniref:hypothetical protein n=1 Tax=Neobacillus sp. NPDC093182 TaxID=3364297 RepID=UPI003818569F
MVKTILGEHSPINLVIDAKLYDVEIGNGATYKFALSPNRTLAGLTIRGNGGVIDGLEFHLRTRISLLFSQRKLKALPFSLKVKNFGCCYRDSN